MPLDLSEEVLKRAVAQQTAPAQQRRSGGAQAPKQATPTLMGILGALADGASTATFLKRGVASEDNALYRPLKGHPAATGAAVAGTGLAAVGLGKLLGKKFPALADALTANYAGHAIGYAGKNAEAGRFGESSADSYRKAIMRAMGEK